MSEHVEVPHEEVEEKKEEKKKGVLGKLKDKILPDQEEQAAIFSTFVRLGVLVWSWGNFDIKLCCHTWTSSAENRSDIYSFSFYRSFS